MITDYKRYQMMEQLASFEFNFPTAGPTMTIAPVVTPAPETTEIPEATPTPEPVFYYLSADDQMVIGIITIDKIKVKIPIIEGVEEEQLNVAIGHMTGTALPGRAGNAVLAGHRMYTFGQFFNRLDELEIGDIISIMYGNAIYDYTVYEKLVVLPEETSVLDANMNEKTVTLITCTPPYVFSHRLIVKARLN